MPRTSAERPVMPQTPVAAGSRGVLVVVATPIGNLGDLAPRALSTLEQADHICCEDTRRTRRLLAAAHLRAGARLVSLHEHNEEARIPQVLAWLAAGETVALVSDAGTPTVSDPGGRLVAATVGAGARVSAVPGPSAVLAALVVSGFAGERFCVEGFLPRRGPARRRRLAELSSETRTAVVLEAPHRLATTLRELAEIDAQRRVAVVREMTKIHEEVWRGTVGEAAHEFSQRVMRGEVVVVLEGGREPPAASVSADLASAVRARLSAGEAASRVAAALSAEFGVPRREVYELAVRSTRPAGGQGRVGVQPGPPNGR